MFQQSRVTTIPAIMQVRHRAPAAAAAVFPYSNFLTQAYTGTRNNYSGTLGFRILVGGSPIVVVALGRSISTAITTNHRVGMWKIDGTSIGYVTVSGSSPVDPLGYAYELLGSPVTLDAATQYVIGSEEFNGGDKWRDSGSLSGHLATASIVEGRYSAGSGFVFPDIVYGAANTGYVPPTFYT